jgi:hypothetical protein
MTAGALIAPCPAAVRRRASGLSEKVIWQLLQEYATAAGVPGIAPHNLRRTSAKMCRAAGAELEQIQLLLGAGFRADDRTVPGHEAGSVAGSERWNQAASGGLDTAGPRAGRTAWKSVLECLCVESRMAEDARLRKIQGGKEAGKRADAARKNPFRPKPLRRIHRKGFLQSPKAAPARHAKQSLSLPRKPRPRATPHSRRFPF